MAKGLSITNLTKTWNADGPAPVPAVRNLSLDVEPGEFVVLLGPSGCGKSSLLYIAAGLEEPTSGKITFDDLPITEPSPERSLIFQEAALFPWLTVRDNVGFGLSIRGGQPAARAERVEALLKQVGLGGIGDRRPDQLSGGMRQRVALARALAMKPKLLLMDEPFAALDIQTRARMQDHLLAVWRDSGASVLLVTHSIDEALALADRIIVFTARPGQIKAELKIDAPRPRDLYAPDMVALARECEALLAEEVTKAFAEQEFA